ncbi:hypothetical protein BDZ85DRAFT_41979 [Elsinoe ampelina]|uniref:AA1-like domain-containing protein n=1 Tax=Elsinoe ampelina TaxID=302913 RepID=A0A6A6G173_9PEZI|nr:hypothetical protein BDZ85DRAFT_41979 [Elsinoe ampelina]
MKVPSILFALAASTALAAPTAQPEAEADVRITERDGPSLVTYAVSGFRITDLTAVIKPWSIFTTTTGNTINFTVQPLSATSQALGDPVTCQKTWTDSVLRGTGSTVVRIMTSIFAIWTPEVKCSNSNLSFYISRNYLYSYQINVNLAYTLVRSANGTAGTQYSSTFALNEKSVQLKCVKDKNNAQTCAWSGTALSASTLSSKSVS